MKPLSARDAAFLVATFALVVTFVVVGLSQERRGGAAGQVAIDPDDIGGTVRSAAGPEAGVWVIAETSDLPTKLRKIVVTDDQGRYVLPDLPRARFSIWVRGYGLVDSAKVDARPGTQLNLTAIIAPTPREAARYYPGDSWYSLLNIPSQSDFPLGDEATARTQADYVFGLKRGCQACHQMGNQATREIPLALGTFPSTVAAWERRLHSGQTGPQMLAALNAFGRRRGLAMFAD